MREYNIGLPIQNMDLAQKNWGDGNSSCRHRDTILKHAFLRLVWVGRQEHGIEPIRTRNHLKQPCETYSKTFIRKVYGGNLA